MTSEEIKRYEMKRDGSIEYRPLWLKEIAYQLAVMNERNRDWTFEDADRVMTALRDSKMFKQP